jgi:hypothetical protein
MTARSRLLLGLALALAVLAGWALHSQFQWRREEEWVGLQGEARSNDYLAAQRLLQRMAHSAESVAAIPDGLPPPGDVLILPRRVQPMLRPEAARIAAWVERGGLLVAAGAVADAGGQDRTPDALFELFGARLEPAEAGPGGDDPITLRYQLDQADLQVEMGGPLRIQAPGREPRDQAGPAAGTALLRCPLGGGEALLCTDLRCLRNDRIQAFDHADFLCALAARRPDGKVWIVVHPPSGGFWGWLAARAWPFLAALAALLLGAVWAAAPRFGPLLPDPDPARRSFLEHLEACGRYQWRAARGQQLLAAVREAFSRRLARLHPGWAGLEPPALCQRLTQRTGMSAERIERALHLPGPAHAPGFLEAVQTLRHLERNL